MLEPERFDMIESLNVFVEKIKNLFKKLKAGNSYNTPIIRHTPLCSISGLKKYC
jgi:hypothetical protein